MSRKVSIEEKRLALLLDASDTELTSIIAQAKTILRYRTSLLTAVRPVRLKKTRVRKAKANPAQELPTE